MSDPGVFEAKVVDYGVTKSKADKPMAMIRFIYSGEDGTDKFINWYGSFASEKSSEITCAALALCGWSTNNPADLAKGKGSGVLDETKTVSITLANEEYNGKTNLKVKYINPVGGAAFRNQIGQADAVKMFAGLNIGGIAAKARASQPKVEKKELKNFAPGADKKDDEEPLPF